MPQAAAKRQQLMLLRRHVRSLLALPKGTASGPVEQAVMTCCRRLARAMSPEELATLTNDSAPGWLTPDVVRHVYDGHPWEGPQGIAAAAVVAPGEAPLPEAAPPPAPAVQAEVPQAAAAAAAAGGSKRYRWSRGLDAYLAEHKEALKGAIRAKQKAGSQRAKINFQAQWRRLGLLPQWLSQSGEDRGATQRAVGRASPRCAALRSQTQQRTMQGSVRLDSPSRPKQQGQNPRDVGLLF
jgi:hypothetical protein